MHAHLNDPKDQPPSDTNEPRKYVKKLPSLPSLCLNYERDESLDQSDYPLKRAKNAHCLEKLRDNSHNHVGFLSYNTQTALLACLRRLVQPHEDSISLSISLTVSERCNARVLQKLHKLGFLHRDCHHGNILMKKGRAILVDFKSALVIISANAAERKKQDLETLRAACGIFA
jgi:hypothetical protein